jgi:MinD superfamily P-loop ATPase
MKAIVIYSGKGGVGKTTVSSLLALSISKKKKVALIDFDINTPSLPTMFSEKKQIGNLKIISTGFGKKVMLGYVGKTVRKILNSLIEEANEFNPDICIIDMPPSTNDIHLAVCEEIKPSGFILVTQSNKLSEDDAMRGTALFLNTDIPIIGTIHNMTGEIFGEVKESKLKLPVLAEIKLNKEIAKKGQSGRIYEIENNPLDCVCEKLLIGLKDVSWKTENVSDWGGLSESEIQKIQIPYEKLRYLGTNSWDYIRGKIQAQELFPDRMLIENDSKTIKRVLENLDKNNEGFFMIIKPPQTEIKLFSGEIGVCRLLKNNNKSYYNIPRLNYQTDKGDVTLFPHEVKPISEKEYSEYKKDNEYGIATKSTSSRLIPKLGILKEVNNAFSLNQGDWEEHYKELGVK